DFKASKFHTLQRDRLGCHADVFFTQVEVDPLEFLLQLPKIGGDGAQRRRLSGQVELSAGEVLTELAECLQLVSQGSLKPLSGQIQATSSSHLHPPTGLFNLAIAGEKGIDAILKLVILVSPERQLGVKLSCSPEQWI